MKYFSMFSGIGGFEYGIEHAAPRAKCVGYSEIDKYATAIYEYHYPNHFNYGDATEIDPDFIEDFDLLVGGFPCQAFSVAGKRGGFDDTRGTLFFEIARILAEKRPRYFVLENVKGLLSHDRGQTFASMLGVLTDIGYEYQWQVLNSKDFGVPQNRERVFIVGHIRGERRPEVFPIGSLNGEIIQAGDEQPVSGTISTKNQSGQAQWDGSTTLIHNVYGGFNEDKPRKFTDISPTIRTPKGGGHLPMVCEQRVDEGIRTFKGGVCGTLRGTKDCGDKRVKLNQSIRRLTPVECERLQGFPDDWTKHGRHFYDKQGKIIPKEGGKIVEVSDTQRYKCCGNAVTTNVVHTIMEELLLWEYVNSE